MEQRIKSHYSQYWQTHAYMLHSHVSNDVRCHPVLDKCDMIQDCQWSESYFGTKSCLSFDNCKKSSDKLDNCRIYYFKIILKKVKFEMISIYNPSSRGWWKVNSIMELFMVVILSYVWFMWCFYVGLITLIDCLSGLAWRNFDVFEEQQEQHSV